MAGLISVYVLVASGVYSYGVMVAIQNHTLDFLNYKNQPTASYHDALFLEASKEECKEKICKKLPYEALIWPISLGSFLLRTFKYIKND